MNTPKISDKLNISGAKRLPFLVFGREVFHYPGSRENYHLLFEDITELDSFPIILGGDWDTQQLTHDFVSIIAGKYVWEERACIFIFRQQNGSYELDVFQKRFEDELPLVNNVPLHSTHQLNWKMTGNNIIQSSRVAGATQRKISDRLNSY